MSQFYPIPVAGVVGMTVGLTLLDTTGLSQLAVATVSVVAAALAGSAWIASSLPNGSMVPAPSGGSDE